jgi:hypothetical protein
MTMPRFFPPLYCLRIQSDFALWHLPFWYTLLRWFCVVLVALALGYSTPSFGFFEIFILLFCLAAATFTEQFRWYKNPLLLEKKWGFGFFQFSTRWALDQSSKLICQKSGKKTILQMITLEGLLTLDKTATEFESKRLIELGQKTSSWLGLSLVVQETSH